MKDQSQSVSKVLYPQRWETKISKFDFCICIKIKSVPHHLNKSKYTLFINLILFYNLITFKISHNWLSFGLIYAGVGFCVS